MKWPWVSRAMHDLVVARADELIAFLRRENNRLTEALAEEQEHSRDLAERALQMRKAGFEPPPPPPPEPEPELPKEVVEAIAQRAFDPVTERRLYAYARQKLTVEESAVVAANILAGEAVEDEL